MHAFIPGILGRIPRRWARPTGRVDHNIDPAKALVSGLTDQVLGIGGCRIGRDDDRSLAACSGNLGSQFLKQVAPPRDDGSARAFRRQHCRRCPAKALAGAGDQATLPFQLQIH